MPFWPSGNHQNPYSSYIFYEFVRNFQKRRKYGFRKYISSWIFEPKIQKTLPKLFEKFIITSILKVSDKFIEKCRRVGILVIDTCPKWFFEMCPFLWFFGDQSDQFVFN